MAVRSWWQALLFPDLGSVSSCVRVSFCSGHYNVNESLVRQSPKFLMSCFKSKTGRGLKLTSTGPGPGYYNPNDQTKILKKAHLP